MIHVQKSNAIHVHIHNFDIQRELTANTFFYFIFLLHNCLFANIFWQLNFAGQVSVIGRESGMVTCFCVRSRCCKFCEYPKGKNEPVPYHECSKNWDGSSKAMEPDIAVTMTHKMEDDGFPIDVIHADNDSTPIMKLKMDFKDLKKKDDQNHTIKRITKSLIELSKR